MILKKVFLISLLVMICGCFTYPKRVKRAFYHKKRNPHSIYPQMKMIDMGIFHLHAPVKKQPITIGSFYMSQYEITNSQFAYFLNDVKDTAAWYYDSEDSIQYIALVQHPDFNIEFNANHQYQPKEGYENHPVTCVTYFGAEEYCRWLTQHYAQVQEIPLDNIPRFRLPSFYEWGAAASQSIYQDSIPETKFVASDDANKVAWYQENAQKITHPVGMKRKNRYGIYDMSGNVAEWCEDEYPLKDFSYVDWFSMYYYRGDSSVVRGGSFLDDTLALEKKHYRGFPIDSASTSIVFRIVQTYLGKSSGVEF